MAGRFCVAGVLPLFRKFEEVTRDDVCPEGLQDSAQVSTLGNLKNDGSPWKGDRRQVNLAPLAAQNLEHSIETSHK